MRSPRIRLPPCSAMRNGASGSGSFAIAASRSARSCLTAGSLRVAAAVTSSSCNPGFTSPAASFRNARRDRRPIARRRPCAGARHLAGCPPPAVNSSRSAGDDCVRRAPDRRGGLSSRGIRAALASVIANGRHRGAEDRLPRPRHVTTPRADAIFVEQLRKLAAGDVKPGLQLELVTAAATRSDPAVKQLLADRDAAIAKDPDPLAPFRSRCRAATGSAANAFSTTSRSWRACAATASAPRAAARPARTSRAPAENIRANTSSSPVVKPNAKIAAGFDTIVVTLKAGGIAPASSRARPRTCFSLRDMETNCTRSRRPTSPSAKARRSSMPEISVRF